MTHRYAQGDGRRGERSEQLSAVRSCLVEMVRDAFRRFGRPWTEFPEGLADWDILCPVATLAVAAPRYCVTSLS